MYEESIYKNYELDFNKDYDVNTEAYYILVNNKRQVYLTKDNTIPLVIQNKLNKFTINFKFYIGKYKNKPCFTCNVDEDTNFHDLTEVYMINPETYQISTRAVLINEWYINNKYCGRCGTKTKLKDTHMNLKCPNCGKSHHATIEPAVIIGIQKDNKLLMARHSYDTKVEYALIAGFVEPGESIEDAVHREVKEEVGINIKNLKYIGSQSWPFPNSLMCAYKAEYDSGEIKVDGNEILKAKLFKKEEIEKTESSISIYSKIIDDFCNSN
ncbi:NAD(+) diphosphatase [Methanosphaera sp. WGK6]|uniref:NAD(+) diphosphatase n=1 Tax=Methanosphaera sp. WGK6 TaxID=1561964 RepID=UPI00084CDC69|nr:NAD(+) diphosphatase [Methanosphaera sp. WGK6]OED29759.1 NudC [Methanosphaera sp. WGK6]